MSNPVQRAQGKGALIFKHEGVRHYGHVEVVVEPVLNSAHYTLAWCVPDGMVPPDQRSVIMATASRFLDRFMSERPCCGFAVSIVDGTWLGDALNDAYDQATEVALTHALRNAHITTQVA